MNGDAIPAWVDLAFYSLTLVAGVLVCINAVIVAAKLLHREGIATAIVQHTSIFASYFRLGGGNRVRRS